MIKFSTKITHQLWNGSRLLRNDINSIEYKFLEHFNVKNFKHIAVYVVNRNEMDPIDALVEAILLIES